MWLLDFLEEPPVLNKCLQFENNYENIFVPLQNGGMYKSCLVKHSVKYFFDSCDVSAGYLMYRFRNKNILKPLYRFMIFILP
jgi:hypothetical protein